MMNNFEQQPYSELIYRFMDGETDGVQQKVLFDALAKDSELQFEFQQAVAIVKGFNADKMALLPPARLTNTVFAAAGFTAPMQFANNASNSFLTTLKKLALPVSSALTGAIISAFIFFGFFNSNNSGSISSQSGIQSHLPADQPVNTVMNNNNSAISNLTSESTKIEAKENLDLYSNSTNSFTSEINESNIVETQTDSPVLSNNQDLSNINNEAYSETVKDPGLLNINLEIKGNTNLAFLPNRDIAPEKFNIGNNIAVGLLYSITDNQSAGIYVGRESLQMYSYSQVGEDYVFNLEPSLFWAGACYKYTGAELYGSLHPFTEVILAGTKFGPLAKTAIGLTYNPENFISMSLGIEGSSLIYKFMGDYKTTEKVSFIYNIGINF